MPTTTPSPPLIFYDISSPLQPRSYAPNPSKTRLALNFKRLAFTTRYTDILDIASVRAALACPVTRHLDDGTEFPTLPILQDPATGAVVGDSVDIANYLEETYPGEGGCLFPPTDADADAEAEAEGKAKGWRAYESPCKDTPFYAPLSIRPASTPNAAYARFNVHVDATFSAHVGPFAEFLPFNPATAEAIKALFARRAGLPSWDVLSVQGEARRPLLEAFRADLGTLAGLFGAEGGPFLEGERASYADLIVGGWLNMLEVVMPAEEWVEFRGWYGGVFARLHDVLQERYA
jgi:glutathione S-transferase